MKTLDTSTARVQTRWALALAPRTWGERFLSGATLPAVAAWLMAVCWRGMNTEETLALTLGMRDSGRRVAAKRGSLPGLPRALS